MLFRDKFESEYGTLFDKHHMGSTIWYPLYGGILTGKYNQEIPPDTRLGNKDYSFMYGEFLTTKREETVAKLKKLEVVAKKLGITMACLALAWAIKNKDVSVALVGASKVS